MSKKKNKNKLPDPVVIDMNNVIHFIDTIGDPNILEIIGDYAYIEKRKIESKVQIKNLGIDPGFH